MSEKLLPLIIPRGGANKHSFPFAIMGCGVSAEGRQGGGPAGEGADARSGAWGHRKPFLGKGWGSV